MYLGRKLLLLFVLLISMGVIFQVSSYSYARVSSPVTITISSSENSLIAVDDTLEKDECSFFITNNLNETIKVKVDICKKSIDSSTNMPIAVSESAREGMFIAPGEKKKVMLVIAEGIESGDYEVTIYADWKNGSAKIHKTVSINVGTDQRTVVKDLR